MTAPRKAKTKARAPGERRRGGRAPDPGLDLEPEVVVVGGERDEHALDVATAVGARGARVLLLDLEPFPALLPLALEGDAPLYRGFDLRCARAVYVRSVHMRLPFYAVEMRAREGEGEGEGEGATSAASLLESCHAAWALERDRQSFLTAFVLAFERAGARVVNPTASIDQHFVKLDQLAILRAAGVPVPRTLGANDPEAVRAFVAARRGRVVVKPLSGGAACRRLLPSDLDAGRLRELAAAPAIFQEEAPGRDVRVYAIGGRAVVAYEIETDEVDFRGHEKAVREISLPRAIREACERAAGACGMPFTGIDVKVGEDGKFLVLECNPSPMFRGFERWTGRTAVTSALADYLVTEARRKERR